MESLRQGVLAPFLAGGAVWDVTEAVLPDPMVADGNHDSVFAPYVLQDVQDYRRALQSWFRAVRNGGFLVVVVPHAFLYERQYALPSRWNPRQRRLYTPASLLAEVEEALEPNSYRLRWISDADQGYDYTIENGDEPIGESDILLAIEKIAMPAWRLETFPARDEPVALAPDYAFEPMRTRIEFTALRPRGRILILKLDHLGDFIMGVEALRKARDIFVGSEITLVVGEWNLAIARDLGVADHVVAFNAFPRNSSEEEVDVPGKTALFQGLMTQNYDLAIDLRTDHDTRFLLRHVRAGLRAGIGTAAQFPFLDIFLPIDQTRGQLEAAAEYRFDHRDFACGNGAERGAYRIRSVANARQGDAIVWGPYRRLRPGNYVFEPFLEVEPNSIGLVRLDIAIAARPLVERFVSGPDTSRLAFSVEQEGDFEFRIWSQSDPSLVFDMLGGRLMRQGAASVLHQSEYLMLLVELVSIRTDRIGVFGEWRDIT